MACYFLLNFVLQEKCPILKELPEAITCYFLLNFVRKRVTRSELIRRALPCYFLLNFVDGLALFDGYDVVGHLLFSFEFCCIEIL